MNRVKIGLSLLIALMVGVLAAAAPGQAQTGWPPFSFELASRYQDGKILYTVTFSKKVDWAMTDLVFKIPLPEGTRFIEAGAPETTATDFDGAEITFFTPVLHRPLNDAYFIVEVIDPTQTVYATRAWIAWKGDAPGDYLTRDSTIDISRAPLDWERPRSRLRLEAKATLADGIITYELYPRNIGGRRMWDVTITAPVPAGTTFIKAEAPPPFETGFDGQQVIFSVLELERRADAGPLRFQVSTGGVTDPLVATRAWATWNNVGRNVAQQEVTSTGNLVIQPASGRQVAVADEVDDVPFANYDLASVALAQEDSALKITFHTAGDMGPIGEPLEHYLYIDRDCSLDTGKSRGNRGAELWLRYRHQSGRAYLYTWDAAGNTWTDRRRIDAQPATGALAAVWLPQETLPGASQICWLAVSRHRTEAYHPNPPVDWAGRNPQLSQFTLRSAGGS